MTKKKSKVICCGGMGFDAKRDLKEEDKEYLEDMDLWFDELEAHINSNVEQGKCYEIGLREMREMIKLNKAQISLVRKRIRRGQKEVRDYMKKEGYL